MALGIRYSGSILSREGVVWRVDILQEGYGGTQAGELMFPDDNPLEIVWDDTDKLDPVQSSSATLKIISDTDRRFIDLYTVAVGAMRLDVYRDGALYWSGTLDTELYEEPYSSADGYNVTLTFADFACLERMDWTGKGLVTVHALIESCLQMSGINCPEIDESLVSTTYDYSISAQNASVMQENFYDEDGSPMTAREVMEEVLRPFALRLIQKGGKVWLYDLNALSAAAATEVKWYGTDAELSADRIYNNVKVTYSPYADAALMRGTVDEDEALTADSGGRLVKVDYESNDYGEIKSADGFRFHYNDTMKSNMTLAGGAKFFQIRSIFSGTDATGVAATMKAGDYSVAENDGATTKCVNLLRAPADCGTIAGGNINTQTLITCPLAFLGDVSYRKGEYQLRIGLSLLFDVRYNPFESAGDNNENMGWKNGKLKANRDGPWQNMQDWCNFGYVPIRLTLQNAAGTALYHYENREALESDTYTEKGKWVAGAATWGQAFLCYYDHDDRKSKTGFGGWQQNRQTIGYYRGDLPQAWKYMEEGEYIPLPPAGGYLLLEIGSGVHQFDYKREVKNIYRFCRWILYREPSITLCKRNGSEAATEDIEDSAYLNRAAREELSIDTIVGTVGQRHGVPGGLGQLFRSSLSVITEFSRAGVTTRLERLLIGTAFSQYAERHNTLAGTVRLLPAFGPFADQNGITAGKFVLLREAQNVKEDESEIVMAEFGADDYEGMDN